jgi:hypothetical protein
MTTTERTHFIKVRETGGKTWKFLASGGSETRLRIHALQFSHERAQEAVAQLGADNPGFEFKVVSIK